MELMESPGRNPIEQLPEKTSSQERKALFEDVLIEKAISNNIEVLPEHKTNTVERGRYTQLIHFLESIQEHPGQALYWPKLSNEVPLWIHSYFQDDLPQEQARFRTLQEILTHSTIFSQHISEKELNTIFRVKNALRLQIQEYFSPEPNEDLFAAQDLSAINAMDLPDEQMDDAYFEAMFKKSLSSEEEKALTMPLNLFVTLLGKVFTDQAVALHALQLAQRNLSIHAPALLPKLPINIQADPLLHYGGGYSGQTENEHIINLEPPQTVSIAELASPTSTPSLELVTSIVEHELLHARQSEALASKHAQEVSPFFVFNQSSAELLRKFSSDTGLPADDFTLMGLAYEEAYDKKNRSRDALPLIQAVLEGQVMIHQVQLMNQKIQASEDPQSRAALEEAKDSLLKSLRVGLSKEEIKALSQMPSDKHEKQGSELRKKRKIQQRNFEGRRMFAKLYKEFGIDALPELFGYLDFGSILRLKATPETLKKYMDEPRLLPGLQRSPLIQESLQNRPPVSGSTAI